MSRAAPALAERDSASVLTERDLAEALGWVQAARAVAVERFPYLDVALTAMIPVARVGLGTVAVDARWRFYYNPARVLALTAGGSVNPIVGDWIHEVGHLLRDHHQRWTELAEPPARHTVFNVAGDALINADLAELGLPLLPHDVTFAALPEDAGVRREMTTEEIYLRLLPHGTHDLSPDSVSPDGAGPGPRGAATPPHGGRGRHGQVGDSGSRQVGTGPGRRDCGSGAGGGRRAWERPLDDAADSPGTADAQTGREDGSVDPGRADSIREETAIRVRAHARGQGEGHLPQGLRHWADTVLDPVVDWRRELRSVVSRALAPVAGNRDYAWGRPARRRVPGYVLPGMVSPAPPAVAVVVDTSGSMSDESLAQCLADVAGIVRAAAGTAAPRPVRVIPCDACAGQVQAVRTRHGLPQLQLTGGGGTDMGAGISAAIALRPRPDVVVVLTDGMTGWPDESPATRCRCIAVILDAAPDDPTVTSVPEWIHAIPAPGRGT